MKKLVLALLALLISTHIFSQTFISDKQSVIAKGTTEVVEYTPHERKIVLDSINNTIEIELLDGSTIKRDVRFINDVYKSVGTIYDGYYGTPEGEKIYVRNHEIGFHALKTLGYFITYKLKGKIQPTQEEYRKDNEQTMYTNIYKSRGLHDAECYKFKRIEIGISEFTVLDIMDEIKPLYHEEFWKDSKLVKVIVYPKYVIRIEDFKVDKVVKIDS